MTRLQWMLKTFPVNLLLAGAAYAVAELVLLTVYVTDPRPGLLQAATWITRVLYAVTAVVLAAEWRRIRHARRQRSQKVAGPDTLGDSDAGWSSSDSSLGS